MANQQFDERRPFLYKQPFVTTDGTDAIYCWQGDWAASRIDALFVTNYDSIDHTVRVGGYDGAFIYPFVTTTVPAAVAGVPTTVEVIQTIAPLGQGLIIPTGAHVQAALTEAVTDDTTPVVLLFIGGDL